MLKCIALPPGPAGILITDVSIGQHVLQQTEYEGSRATEVHVRRLELGFPSLSRPVTLRVLGVSLVLQQIRLPKVRALS